MPRIEYIEEDKIVLRVKIIGLMVLKLKGLISGLNGLIQAVPQLQTSRQILHLHVVAQ